MSSQFNPSTNLISGWTVVCDARKGNEMGIGHLVLVDQERDYTLWWTSDDPTIVMSYPSKALAEHACLKFRHNNPRVLTVEAAMQLLAHQNRNVAMRTLEKVGGE